MWKFCSSAVAWVRLQLAWVAASLDTTDSSVVRMDKTQPHCDWKCRFLRPGLCQKTIAMLMLVTSGRIFLLLVPAPLIPYGAVE
jgi:hypothetical protein